MQKYSAYATSAIDIQIGANISPSHPNTLNALHPQIIYIEMILFVPSQLSYTKRARPPAETKKNSLKKPLHPKAHAHDAQGGTEDGAW